MENSGESDLDVEILIESLPVVYLAADVSGREAFKVLVVNPGLPIMLGYSYVHRGSEFVKPEVGECLHLVCGNGWNCIVRVGHVSEEKWHSDSKENDRLKAEGAPPYYDIIVVLERKLPNFI